LKIEDITRLRHMLQQVS